MQMDVCDLVHLRQQSALSALRSAELTHFESRPRLWHPMGAGAANEAPPVHHRRDVSPTVLAVATWMVHTSGPRCYPTISPTP